MYHGRNEQNSKSSYQEGNYKLERASVLWKAYASRENDVDNRQSAGHDVALRQVL
jgi:hypothetical protein